MNIHLCLSIILTSCFKMVLFFIVLWCNGNTSVFGAEFIGSSPMRTTINGHIVQGKEHKISNLIISVRV